MDSIISVVLVNNDVVISNCDCAVFPSSHFDSIVKRTIKIYLIVNLNVF